MITERYTQKGTQTTVQGDSLRPMVHFYKLRITPRGLMIRT